MKLVTGIIGHGFFITAMVLFVAFVLFIPAEGVSMEPGPRALGVTLKITKVRAREYSSIELEGKFKGKEVREVLMACHVVLDNQTGEELTVRSNFHSALDYLTLELFRDDKRVVAVDYISHLSPSSSDGRPFILKKGQTSVEMRFPIRLPPEDWPKLQARLRGFLPGSDFKGVLKSNKLEIQRMADLDSSPK